METAIETPPIAPADAVAAPVAPTPEEIAEKRVLRLASERQALRKEREQQKDVLSAGEAKRKADALVKEGKYVEALETLGVDPDDFYLKATDQIAGRQVAAKDPEAIAKKIVDETLKAREEAEEQAARSEVLGAWTKATQGILFDKAAEFPDVTRAVVAGRFSHEDILRYGQARADRGLPSDPAATLKALQDGLAPKATGSAAPPAALVSNAPPSKPEDWDALPLEEALARAKAKFQQPRK